MNEIQKKFGITEEELKVLDAIEDVMDEAVLRDRLRRCDIDDESNLLTEDEVWAKLGITQAAADAVGEIRFD